MLMFKIDNASIVLENHFFCGVMEMMFSSECWTEIAENI